jgi:hypothetical protein
MTEKWVNPTPHHIGYVVPSIAAVGARFAKSVAATWDERIIHDPLQKVLVSFLTPAGESTAQIELVELSGEDSPLPAPAFHGRRIAWMLTPDRLFLEFLERAGA